MSASSATLLVGVHQPGTSVLHRMPVGLKLLGLVALSVSIVVVRSAPASGGFLAVALLLLLVGRVPLRTTALALRAVLVVAVAAALLQGWFYGVPKAVETLVDLVALALLAVVVSSTTAVNAILDALLRWLRPLRVLGLRPGRIALTVTLAVQALPGTVALALETRDAARARGAGRHPRAYLTPFVVRVVARAHETGDALAARGLGDDDPDPDLAPSAGPEPVSVAARGA